jgi:hypothetical protein
MSWKKQLAGFEHRKEWDEAIELMQHVIAENSYDLDACLSMNYLLMNLLVEEDYNRRKLDYCVGWLIRWSYTLLNPESIDSE